MVKALTSLSFSADEMPGMAAQEQVVQLLADILSRAQAIGRAHASDEKQERASWVQERNPVTSAWNIVTNFVRRIADWITGSDRQESTAQDIADQVNTLAQTVADTEVHAAVEGAVLETLQVQGVPNIIWIAQEGACEQCQANADQGAIPIGTAFETGDDYPPAHPRCRCSLGMA